MRNPRGRALFMGAAGQGRQHRRQTSDEGRIREQVAERPPICRRLRELDTSEEGCGPSNRRSPREVGQPSKSCHQTSQLELEGRAIYTWSRRKRAKAKCVVFSLKIAKRGDQCVPLQ